MFGHRHVLEMFGDAALFSDPSLRCEAVACSKGSPGLEATDVQKEFLQLLQPFEEKNMNYLSLGATTLGLLSGFGSYDSCVKLQ